MRNIRRKLLVFRPLVWLASIKLTLVCLLLLFFLTLGGTIAQISDGLYLAQQRYFESFVFFLFGFLPFPGAQLVMWVLFVNLVCVALVRFNYLWRNAGILIVHAGLMLFLVSAFVTLHSTTESQVTLSEGESTNVSVSYHDWEIALWLQKPTSDGTEGQRHIVAIDPLSMKSGERVTLDEFRSVLSKTNYYANCRMVRDQGSPVRFEQADLLPESEKNTPCGEFTVQSADGQSEKLQLSGDQDTPIAVRTAAGDMRASLRLKRYPLPFLIKLKKFTKEEHPGTATPRSFQSLVEVVENGAGRDKLIQMNEPLRYNDYTLYQASFTEGAGRTHTSTLAVVRNSGRLMPYFSTFITFFGLALHFGMAALRSKKRKHV